MAAGDTHSVSCVTDQSVTLKGERALKIWDIESLIIEYIGYTVLRCYNCI